METVICSNQDLPKSAAQQKFSAWSGGLAEKMDVFSPPASVGKAPPSFLSCFASDGTAVAAILWKPKNMGSWTLWKTTTGGTGDVAR
jgi:hypothetical protein